jgi:hypothetical protein
MDCLSDIVLRQPHAVRLRNGSYCLGCARARCLLPGNCRPGSLAVKTFQEGHLQPYTAGGPNSIPCLVAGQGYNPANGRQAVNGGILDLFDKCRQFDLAIQSARARSRFFYSRAITPAATPLTTRDDGYSPRQPADDAHRRAVADCSPEAHPCRQRAKNHLMRSGQ